MLIGHKDIPPCTSMEVKSASHLSANVGFGVVAEIEVGATQFRNGDALMRHFDPVAQNSRMSNCNVQRFAKHIYSVSLPAVALETASVLSSIATVD